MIKEVLEFYKKENEEINRFEQKIKENRKNLDIFVKDSVDLNEVDKKYNYLEAKELINELGRFKYEENVKKFLQIKKEREYPEILGVHYFSEIKEITWLSEEDKVELDKLLKSIYNKSPRYYSWKLAEMDKETLNFLKYKKIIEKRYKFTCHCDYNDECEIVYITEDQKQKFYDYYSFDYNNATNEEREKHDDEWKENGYFDVGCWNDGGYEVCSIEEFEENVSDDVGYKVIKEPDMTLDRL